MGRPPAVETSGRNRQCLKCTKCRTQTFRSLAVLDKWGHDREFHIRLDWTKNLEIYGKLQLYWCAAEYGRPRMYRTFDTQFRKYCLKFRPFKLENKG